MCVISESVLLRSLGLLPVQTPSRSGHHAVNYNINNVVATSAVSVVLSADNTEDPYLPWVLLQATQVRYVRQLSDVQETVAILLINLRFNI